MLDADGRKEPTPTGPRRRRWPLTLKILVALYAGWLGWLIYVAWINIQSGNV